MFKLPAIVVADIEGS